MTLTSASEAERHAERLQKELAGTLDQLVGNLSPARLASEVTSAAGARTPGWLKDYVRFARSPIGLGLVGATAASLVVGLLSTRRRCDVSRSRFEPVSRAPPSA